MEKQNSIMVHHQDGTVEEIALETALADGLFLEGRLAPGTTFPPGLEIIRLFGGVIGPETPLPEGLKYLELRSGVVEAGVVLPAGLRFLECQPSVKLPEDLAIPEGLDELWVGPLNLRSPVVPGLPPNLRRLDLNGGTLPDGMALPASLQILRLDGGTLPPGTKLPESLRQLDLGGGILPAGNEIPQGCKVYGIRSEGAYGPAPAHFARDPAAEAETGGVRV